MILTRTPILRRRPVYVSAGSLQLSKNMSATPEVAHSPFIPLSNVQAFKDHFEIYLALPGYAREDVSIAFENDTLIATGVQANSDTAKYSRKEIASGNFRRKFKLPKTRGTYSFTAEMKNGILTIKVIKPEELKPLQITVA